MDDEQAFLFDDEIASAQHVARSSTARSSMPVAKQRRISKRAVYGDLYDGDDEDDDVVLDEPLLSNEATSVAPLPGNEKFAGLTLCQWERDIIWSDEQAEPTAVDDRSTLRRQRAVVLGNERAPTPALLSNGASSNAALLSNAPFGELVERIVVPAGIARRLGDEYRPDHRALLVIHIAAAGILSLLSLL
jgi:hypothetical protein